MRDLVGAVFCAVGNNARFIQTVQTGIQILQRRFDRVSCGKMDAALLLFTLDGLL
ncbi:hypothetical protein SDC9_101810 [bioreactor metagenome]|uniref:Uncharacterized protein n=1 Tax=bioreactor metagenome TaxID=1076179 RepID=A0A645AP53_9ZZZZ